MKKLLLSMLAVAAVAGTAAAETLEVKNATEIKGTLVEEIPAGTEGYTNGQAKHYQPLQSLKIDGYTFTFTKGNAANEPAYYYSMSTSQNQKMTIRLYKPEQDQKTGNTMTVKAPEGKSFKSIVLNGEKGTTDKPNVSVGTVSSASSSKIAWSNADAVSEVTFTMTNAFRIESIEVSAEGGASASEGTYSKVETLESGVYVLAIGTQVAAVDESALSKGYGRMPLQDAVFNGDKVTTDAVNELTITVADGKATIKSGAKFFGMDSQHLTTFQFLDAADDYCYWTFAFENGAVKFTNAKNTGCIIAQSKGNEGFYTNVAPADSPEEFNLPVLYKKQGGSVNGVSVAEDAAPVYYNLQGVRVNNPENGLYIVVKGGKSRKVMF